MPHTTHKPPHRETYGASDGPVFDVETYRSELLAGAQNRRIGTELWFENDRVEVWDLSLQPGERLAFHCHDQTYFGAVTDPALLLQRYDDGTSRWLETRAGQVNFVSYAEGGRTVHDLENVGDTFFRCLTVVLKS